MKIVKEAVKGESYSCSYTDESQAGWIYIIKPGIVKNHEFNLPEKDIELVSLNVIKSLRESVSKG